MSRADNPGQVPEKGRVANIDSGDQDEFETEKNALEEIINDLNIEKIRIQGELQHLEDLIEAEEINSDGLSIVRRIKDILQTRSEAYLKALRRSASSRTSGEPASNTLVYDSENQSSDATHSTHSTHSETNTESSQTTSESAEDVEGLDWGKHTYTITTSRTSAPDHEERSSLDRESLRESEKGFQESFHDDWEIKQGIQELRRHYPPVELRAKSWGWPSWLFSPFTTDPTSKFQNETETTSEQPLPPPQPSQSDQQSSQQQSDEQSNPYDNAHPHFYELSSQELRSASRNRSALPRLFPEIPREHRHRKRQIVFGGCAGMYHYFLGIAAVLQERFDLDDMIFAGVSGGCFPALCLALGLDVRNLHETWNREILKELNNGYLKAFTRLNGIVTQISRKHLPGDAHIRAKDKLFISLTEFPSLKNHIVHHWKDRDDLIECILASCFIPIFDRRFWTYFDKIRYVDGGLSNNKPIPYPDLPYIYITTDRWREIPWHWYWCYTSEEWSDQLYLWGKEDALANIGEFIELFETPVS